MRAKSVLRRVEPALHDDSGGEGSPEVSEHGEDRDEVRYEVIQGYYDESNDGDSHDEDEAEEIDRMTLLSQTSFGTLARAESSINKERNRSKAGSESTSKADRISAVKSQLQAFKSTSSLASKKNSTWSNNDPISKAERLRKTSPPPKRASKSAPTEQSSKKPVSRYREAVEVNIPKARDPRFDSATGGVNEIQFNRNYAFLNEYKEKEIVTLKKEIKKTKRKSTKGGAGLKRDTQEMERALKRMESQKQTQEAKDRSAALVAEHKKKERELIKQGKTPYFLKKSEQKKMVLMDRYSKLGEKELDRVLARKRKHKAAKERKNMPWARRGTDT
ncbi:hypothetical protein BGX38DRAFT_1154530 [Terfezia claveryi]|nr:hypothetical protein BGX38DRAFT_1154530 [Terfezia claveryi]